MFIIPSYRLFWSHKERRVTIATVDIIYSVLYDFIDERSITRQKKKKVMDSSPDEMTLRSKTYQLTRSQDIEPGHHLPYSASPSLPTPNNGHTSRPNGTPILHVHADPGKTRFIGHQRHISPTISSFDSASLPASLPASIYMYWIAHIVNSCTVVMQSYRLDGAKAMLHAYAKQGTW